MSLAYICVTFTSLHESSVVHNKPRMYARLRRYPCKQGVRIWEGVWKLLAIFSLKHGLSPRQVTISILQTLTRRLWASHIAAFLFKILHVYCTPVFGSFSVCSSKQKSASCRCVITCHLLHQTSVPKNRIILDSFLYEFEKHENVVIHNFEKYGILSQVGKILPMQKLFHTCSALW